jgi:hypothetical protein
MKYEEIIKLLDAGYTREEILSMKEPEPAPDDPDQGDPAPDPEPADMTGVVKEMRDMFAEMRKEITALNIMATRQPADNDKSSEDIIASIINPSFEKGGK